MLVKVLGQIIVWFTCWPCFSVQEELGWPTNPWWWFWVRCGQWAGLEDCASIASTNNTWRAQFGVSFWPRPSSSTPGWSEQKTDGRVTVTIKRSDQQDLGVGGSVRPSAHTTLLGEIPGLLSFKLQEINGNTCVSVLNHQHIMCPSK